MDLIQGHCHEACHVASDKEGFWGEEVQSLAEWTPSHLSMPPHTPPHCSVDLQECLKPLSGLSRKLCGVGSRPGEFAGQIPNGTAQLLVWEPRCWRLGGFLPSTVPPKDHPRPQSSHVRCGCWSPRTCQPEHSVTRAGE